MKKLDYMTELCNQVSYLYRKNAVKFKDGVLYIQLSKVKNNQRYLTGYDFTYIDGEYYLVFKIEPNCHHDLLKFREANWYFKLNYPIT